jgi:hypothetical protein
MYGVGAMKMTQRNRVRTKSRRLEADIALGFRGLWRLGFVVTDKSMAVAVPSGILCRRDATCFGNQAVSRRQDLLGKQVFLGRKVLVDIWHLAYYSSRPSEENFVIAGEEAGAGPNNSLLRTVLVDRIDQRLLRRSYCVDTAYENLELFRVIGPIDVEVFDIVVVMLKRQKRRFSVGRDGATDLGTTS